MQVSLPQTRSILTLVRTPGMQWLPAAVAPSRGAETAIFAATSAQAAAARDAFVVPYFAPPMSRRRSWVWPAMLGWEMLQRLSWRPRLSRSSPDSYDADLAQRLWRFSRQAVGVSDIRFGHCS